MMTENEARQIQPPYRRTALHPDYCCASVNGPGGWLSSQCDKKIKILYGSLGYCGIHDPQRVSDRRETADANRKANWKGQQAEFAREQRLNGFRMTCVDAVRQIAAGHNDPRALCAEILGEYSNVSGS